MILNHFIPHELGILMNGREGQRKGSVVDKSPKPACALVKEKDVSKPPVHHFPVPPNPSRPEVTI